jgi:hypothetical protein
MPLATLARRQLQSLLRASYDASPYERVALRAAVRRLNDRVPLWRDRVDLRTLDMADGNRCVLGQLFGDYVTGLTLLATDDLGADLLVDAAFSCNFPVELWVAELTNESAPTADRDLEDVTA